MTNKQEEDLTGGAGQQRVAKRSGLFVLLPAYVLSILSAILVWEVVRSNVDSESRMQWPFRLTFVPAETIATLVAALAGLMLARAQFAKTQQPLVGFSVEGEDPDKELLNDYWVMHVFNGGTGPGTVIWAGYSATLVLDDGTLSSTGWLSPPAMRRTLVGLGLSQPSDFRLMWLGKGAPLVSTASPREGRMVARFHRRAIARLAHFEFKVHFADIVGDEHFRSLDFIYHLPDEIKQLRHASLAD